MSRKEKERKEKKERKDICWLPTKAYGLSGSNKRHERVQTNRKRGKNGKTKKKKKLTTFNGNWEWNIEM